MSRNQQGSGIIEVGLTLVGVAIIMAVGWFVWRAKQNTTSSYDNANQASSSSPVVAADKAPAASKEFVAKQYGFSLKSSFDPATVSVVETPDVSSIGKAYRIDFGTSDKFSAGFITTNWAPVSASTTGVVGFTGYKSCPKASDEKGRYELYSNTDSCAVVAGFESAMGKSAVMTLQKKFTKNTNYAGLEFIAPPVTVKDFSEASLRSAYGSYSAYYLDVLKSVTEL